MRPIWSDASCHPWRLLVRACLSLTLGFTRGKTSTAGRDDDVARIAHEGDPLHAVVRLIWNASGAEADSVTVHLERSQAGAIDEVQVHARYQGGDHARHNHSGDVWRAGRAHGVGADHRVALWEASRLVLRARRGPLPVLVGWRQHREIVRVLDVRHVGRAHARGARAAQDAGLGERRRGSALEGRPWFGPRTLKHPSPSQAT